MYRGNFVLDIVLCEHGSNTTMVLVVVSDAPKRRLTILATTSVYIVPPASDVTSSGDKSRLLREERETKVLSLVFYGEEFGRG